MRHTYKTPEIKVILINACEMLATSIKETGITGNPDIGYVPGVTVDPEDNETGEGLN